MGRYACVYRNRIRRHFATFLYNYFASYLRAVGNSVVPLVFLAVSAVLNIALDLWFVIGLNFGVAGAAGATVIAQYVSGIGIMICALLKCPQLRALCSRSPIHASRIREIAGYSILTCVQQSVMNLGILMGAGACEQLRRGGNGGVCGGGED